MNKEGLVLVGGGLGALIGAVLSTTKCGEEVDERLDKAFDKLNDDVVPLCERIGIGDKNVLV